MARRLPALPPLAEEFAHPWLIEQLERGFISTQPERRREAKRQDLDAWFRFCDDLNIDVLEAHDLHVAGFARYLTEVEGLPRVAVLRTMRTLDEFYGRAAFQNFIAHSPLA